jgi:hypothetical protein
VEDADQLLVEALNGSITLICDGDRRDVEVRAEITTGGQTLELARARLAMAVVECRRDAQGRLLVAARFPSGHSDGDGVSFVVRAPAVGEAELLTSNGAVRVQGVRGELIARTSNGRIDVEDHLGSIDAITSNGHVVLSLAGPAKVRTSNGGVRVTLEGESVGPVDLATHDGSIELNVDSRFLGELDLRSSNGQVRFDNDTGVAVESSVRRDRGTLVFPSGAHSSRAVTVNGDVMVTLRRRGDR